MAKKTAAVQDAPKKSEGGEWGIKTKNSKSCKSSNQPRKGPVPDYNSRKVLTEKGWTKLNPRSPRQKTFDGKVLTPDLTSERVKDLTGEGLVNGKTYKEFAREYAKQKAQEQRDQEQPNYVSAKDLIEVNTSKPGRRKNKSEEVLV